VKIKQFFLPFILLASSYVAAAEPPQEKKTI